MIPFLRNKEARGLPTFPVLPSGGFVALVVASAHAEDERSLTTVEEGER